MANKTVYIQPSGGDYTGLAAAIAGELAANANLVTMAGILNFEIGGTWSSADANSTDIDGFTTSAAYYLNFYTVSPARHAGVWSTDKYNLVADAAYGPIGIYENYTRLDGLQIRNTNPAGSDRHALFINTLTNGGNDVRVSNCIIRGSGHASRTQSLVFAANDYINLSMWNCIGYGLTALAANYGVKVQTTSSGSAKIYSSTFIGGAYCYYRASGAMTIKNCYGGGSLTADYDGTMTMTTCASEDATGTAGLQSVAIDTDTFVNVTANSEDFHLAADGNSPLQDVGTDTSGDSAPFNFTTDIDGVARSGTWDVGADEYVNLAVAPTVTTTTPTALTTAAGTTATSGGNVTDDGGAAVTDAGVCWSTSANPTTSDSHTHDSTGEGAYGSSITGLTHGTLYHVRAWATNSAGTSYGSDETFTPIMGNKIKGII